MTYNVRIYVDASEFLKSLDSKTQRIIKSNLKKLENQPHDSPEAQSGDREKVSVNGEEIYGMHISRSYTAFYTINEEPEQVIITDIDTAHKMYD